MRQRAAAAGVAGWVRNRSRWGCRSGARGTVGRCRAGGALCSDRPAAGVGDERRGFRRGAGGVARVRNPVVERSIWEITMSIRQLSPKSQLLQAWRRRVTSVRGHVAGRGSPGQRPLESLLRCLSPHGEDNPLESARTAGQMPPNLRNLDRSGLSQRKPPDPRSERDQRQRPSARANPRPPESTPSPAGSPQPRSVRRAPSSRHGSPSGTASRPRRWQRPPPGRSAPTPKTPPARTAHPPARSHPPLHRRAEAACSRRWRSRRGPTR